jgi:hypothetical protein
LTLLLEQGVIKEGEEPVDVRENIPSKREAWTRITFQERNK